MAKFDIEIFRDYFVTLFQDNLPTKINEINTEKGDSLLDAISSDQYYDSMNDSVINYDTFIHYFISDITTTDSFQGGVSRSVSVTFAIIFSNMDDWGDAQKKILRYSRALEEVVLDNADHPAISQLSIDVFEPDMIQLSENSPIFKAGGISITGDITT